MSPSPVESLDIDVAGIAGRQFATVRKGYDTGEVRAYLRELSEAVDGVQGQVDDLEAQLEDAEARAAEAGKFDEQQMVAQLGEETARVLSSARAAAADIRQKAQESAARLISAANEQAHQLQTEGETELANQRAAMLAEVDALRREAAGELDRRRAEANQLVAEMRREAQAECDGLRRSGEQSRQDGLADGDRIRAAAREEAKRLVEEAQVVREHMLHDLARRRRTAREQLERLGAARERLLAAYDVVRRTIEEATGELRVVPAEAKIAADVAMRRVQQEPEETTEELEAEVSTARIAGLLEPLAPAEELDEPEDEAFDDELTALDGDVEVIELAEPVAEDEDVVPESDSDSEAVEVAVEPDDLDAEVEVVDDVEDSGEQDGDEADAEPPFDWHAEGDGTPGEFADMRPLPVAPDIDELFARLRGEGETAEGDAAGAEAAQVEAEAPQTVVATLPLDPAIDADVEPEPVHDEVEADELEEADEAIGTVVPFPAAATSSAAEPEVETAAVAEDEPAFEDAAEEIMRRRDETVAEVERSLSRLLKRALADEQNEVLDLLRRAKPTTAEELLPTVSNHVARYADAARDDLDLAALYGAESVGGEPDGTAEALAAELGQTVVDPLRERIVRSFAETGGDLGEVTDRLRALYREWKGQRIGDAAKHYVVAAYALGAYGAVPNGTPLVWLVDRQADACPDADDNALAGTVCKGEGFPTGDHCPPAHLGCRCLVVPAAD